MTTLTDDQRTTAVGLYHFALSYRNAADHLATGPDRHKSTHPDAPRDFLYAHCIELYLKAFLRSEGVTVADLKALGHDIPKLAQRVMGYGVPFDFDVARVFELLTFDNVFGARYIKTGPYRRATTDGLRYAAEALHKVVRDAIRSRGEICSD